MMLITTLLSGFTALILYKSGTPISNILLIVVSYFIIYMFSIRKKKTQYEQPIVEQKKVKKNKAIFFSEHDKSIFNQNSFPMFIVNKNFTIEKSNVAFNSFVGKDASSLHLSLVMRSNELNEGLNDALKNKNKVNVNVIIYDQVHKYVQAQIFPIEIENETFVLIILTDETSQKVSEQIKSDFISNVTH